MRDFVHIKDCIDCVLATKDKINDGSAINISTGKLNNFKQLTTIALNILGHESTPVAGKPEKPEGVYTRGWDTTLQGELGFRTQIDLVKGLALSLDEVAALYG